MLGTNPKNILNFTKPQPPDIKKPTFGARFNSTEEARAALRGKNLGTLPEAQEVQEVQEVQESSTKPRSRGLGTLPEVSQTQETQEKLEEN